MRTVSILCLRIVLGLSIGTWHILTCAQSFSPNKPVKLIVSFAPGGSVDTSARFIAAALGEHWHQAVLVENKPGADGNIAADFVAKNNPDGSVLLITSNAITITPALNTLPFDPLSDLKPIVRVMSIPNFLVVHPSLPIYKVQDLIEYAKRQPSRLSFASSGTGTTPFMGMALLQSISGIQMTHIPFKGSAPAVLATLSNQTQLMFGDLNSTMPHIRAGKFRALGVSGLQRSALATDIPTIAESGVSSLAGFETSTWVGILGPKTMTRSLAQNIAQDVSSVLKSNMIQEKIKTMGAQMNGEMNDDFGSFMRTDLERWSRLVKELEIKAGD
jgi:tripartite-type tricarboxylate transporter receptor subunit TctC